MQGWIDIDNPPQVQYLTPFIDAFERRGVAVIVTARRYGITTELLAARGVAHPAWARGPLRSAEYLPYASRFSPSHAALLDRRGSVSDCVVIGSPRRERALILRDLTHILSGRLQVWGWGPRARLGLNPSARQFRQSLRGAKTLTESQTEAIYRAAGVVLNLQDAQMLGAWNPQTFDVMGLGIPQVVWNRTPAPILANPPPHSATAEGLAELVLFHLDNEQPQAKVLAAFEEAAQRHRWVHRAARFLQVSM